uniref:phenylalanine--tRNA ligase n=1 Tax=Anser cygnoides TaxID=8845 RepID=A0A8B9EMJ8_ANSCY
MVTGPGIPLLLQRLEREPPGPGGGLCSLEAAAALGLDHQTLVGAVKSLQALGEVIEAEARAATRWELSAEGAEVLRDGSPEVRLFRSLPADGLPQSDAMVSRRGPQGWGGVHSQGGYGSQGYKYEWKVEEARKNLLRTHTTSASARALYHLACQDKFTPVKYFSIDRVFRNESLDATHLAEFHQVEGVVADRGLTLGHLMGTLRQFFTKLGITKLRFKPAYNPYTEPSMEVFSYHEGLKKWVEVGNSGVFRPEMLLPMGLPENVSVIAWGLSLERPTMIKYGINNIRELVGHRVNLQMVYDSPLCRLDV